jgi:membrane protein
VPGSVLFFSILEFPYIHKAGWIVLVQALWSAGRGMKALTEGLQWIEGTKETKGYVVVRIRASIYTICLILSILLFLIFGVFGKDFPIYLIIYGIVIFMLLYRFVPESPLKLIHHMPGAVFASCGWMLFTYGFSLYVDWFPGHKEAYGNMTTLVLMMLWLYFGMYLTFLGAEINRFLAKTREKP